MFLGPSQIRESIVLILTTQGATTAEKLHALVNRDYKRCTLQAIYKELAGLREEGVVLKVKGAYGLSISWAVRILEFSDNVARSCLDGGEGLIELPLEGKNLSWKFPGIYPADQVWMQLVLRLLREHTPRRMFQWLSHPWHRLLYGERSTEFEDALRFFGAKDYVIVMGDSYLDYSVYRTWPKDVFVVSSAPSPFHAQGSKFMTVVGEYIIYTEYQASLMRSIDEYYQRIRSARDVKSGEVLSLFRQRTWVKVTLERKAKKASRLASTFERYFGLGRT